jgi:hypothetical protein
MVSQSRMVLLFALSALVLAAADQDWKDKQFPEWTEDDAKEVMKDSPWAKTVVATIVKAPDGVHRSAGIGVRLPGMGRPRDSSSHASQTNGDTSPSSSQPPTLTLRWESALPMQEAELKAHDPGAPALDDDHYAIAVYGIPRGILEDGSKETAEELKKQAIIKREGKKDTKPSSVEILLRENQPVVVYLFPKSADFNWRDHRIEFDAQVARLKFSQSFLTDEMRFHGTLEL